jgi:hypothetical protein
VTVSVLNLMQGFTADMQLDGGPERNFSPGLEPAARVPANASPISQTALFLGLQITPSCPDKIWLIKKR